MADMNIQWTAPAPLWPEVINKNGNGIASDAGAEFTRPAILRFTSDSFMEEMINLLETAPLTLGTLRAVPETWRGPAFAPEPVKPLPIFRRALERKRQASLLATTLAGGNGGSSSPLAPQPSDPFLPWKLSSSGQLEAIDLPLKLYQPAHMRYYLVSACLVCRETGLPDRVLNSATQEKVSFVVRRLVPRDADAATRYGLPAPYDEYALVSEGRKMSWRKINGDPKTLVQGEEQLPLFPLTFTQVDGRKRRIFAGTLPVGKREAYLGAGKSQAAEAGVDETPPPLKAGEQLFLTQVIEPWKRLVELAASANAKQSNTTKDPPFESLSLPSNFWNANRQETRQQIQVTSWYILLDFARLLQQYLPEVWAAVGVTPGSPTGLVPGSPNDILFKSLQDATIITAYANALRAGTIYQDSDVIRSLVDALAEMGGGRPADPNKALALADDLEAVTVVYDRTNPDALWPEFIFPLADPERINDGPLPKAEPGVTPPSDPLEARLARLDYLAELVKAALPDEATAVPALPLVAQPALDGREAWFAVRCVFECPQCDPRLAPAVVSEATSFFQMAGFFDPDAPARPIRIALPIDTSPAGLRKFDKNTAFAMSDMLCGQVQRAKSLSLGDLVLSVLPWPLHKDLSIDTAPCEDDGTTIGMICSLSIPIITICALILLMIIVNLLDLIFHWIPYFILCFPLPKVTAKESG